MSADKIEIAICEYCGKPGDYPVCNPPYRPKRRSRIKELEAELEILEARHKYLVMSAQMALDWGLPHDKDCASPLNRCSCGAWDIANKLRGALAAEPPP